MTFAHTPERSLTSLTLRLLSLKLSSGNSRDLDVCLHGSVFYFPFWVETLLTFKILQLSPTKRDKRKDLLRINYVLRQVRGPNIWKLLNKTTKKGLPLMFFCRF
jgi:hypothetical protein